MATPCALCGRTEPHVHGRGYYPQETVTDSIRAKAEREEAAVKAALRVCHGIADFFEGKASLHITPPLGGMSNGTPWVIRFRRN